MARPAWAKGLVIQDAKQLATINIRGRDITGAVPNRGDCCVAARCTVRALDAHLVYFYRSVAYVMWDEDRPVLRYKLSAALIKNVVEILDDDRRDNSEIRPGTYSLLPPPPAQRLGVNRTPKPGAKKRVTRVDRGHVLRAMGRFSAASKTRRRRAAA